MKMTINDFIFKKDNHKNTFIHKIYIFFLYNHKVYKNNLLSLKKL